MCQICCKEYCFFHIQPVSYACFDSTVTSQSWNLGIFHQVGNPSISTMHSVPSRGNLTHSYSRCYWWRCLWLLLAAVVFSYMWLPLILPPMVSTLLWRLLLCRNLVYSSLTRGMGAEDARNGGCNLATSLWPSLASWALFSASHSSRRFYMASRCSHAMGNTSNYQHT